MKLDKKEFLKSELGSTLQECVKAWDFWLEMRRRNNNEETRKGCNWCQAQWEVLQMAIKQFYGFEYHFSRTEEYYGVCTENETDWLFKVER